VRGVARFDPAHFGPDAKPVLRLSLRHSFTFINGEETIGGRLHAYKNVAVTDVAAGSQPFELDMCMFGEAMWSDENGTFHLIGMLDENGNNNLNNATTNQEAIKISTPDAGELVKLIDLELSCTEPSPCLDLTLDCTEGAPCTTITPITSCTKKMPGCMSDAAYCD
jgi:hypothetical protein